MLIITTVSGTHCQTPNVPDTTPVVFVVYGYVSVRASLLIAD